MKNLNEYKNEDGSYAKNQNSESPGLKEWNDMVKEVKQQREKRKEMKSHYEADVEGPLDTDIKNCLNSESESDDGELSILGVKITPKMTPRMTPISRKCRRATVRNQKVENEVDPKEGTGTERGTLMTTERDFTLEDQKIKDSKIDIENQQLSSRRALIETEFDPTYINESYGISDSVIKRSPLTKKSIVLLRETSKEANLFESRNTLNPQLKFPPNLEASLTTKNSNQINLTPSPAQDTENNADKTTEVSIREQSLKQNGLGLNKKNKDQINMGVSPFNEVFRQSGVESKTKEAPKNINLEPPLVGGTQIHRVVGDSSVDIDLEIGTPINFMEMNGKRDFERFVIEEDSQN